jgi:hypothetical protein
MLVLEEEIQNARNQRKELLRIAKKNAEKSKGGTEATSTDAQYEKWLALNSKVEGLGN